MTIRLKTLQNFSLIICLLAMGTSANAQAQTEAAFQTWLMDFKKIALKKGISQATINQAFENVTLNTQVLELDRRQPEFSKTFWQYFNSAVTDWRVIRGKMLYKKHRPLLDEVTKLTGVPGRYLVAFWGMETNYGSYTGTIPIIESLATLSYDPRRSGFFTNQLIDALTVIDQGHVQPQKMKGSWAGAMGQSQFMPSNYLRYAVDGDNDGKKDLWDSLPDVFHSSGRFLNELGWKKQENWGREVQLPSGFDFALADGKTAKPLSNWAKAGLKLADGRALPKEAMDAKLLLPSDYRGPAFLVFDNFKVIKRWNNSNNYALAVGHLADRIVGRSALSKLQPKDDKALTKQEMKSLQARLNWLGFTAGKPDGIAGSNTRSALRAFQVQQNLPADGHPSHRMLAKLMATHR